MRELSERLQEVMPQVANSAEETSKHAALQEEWGKLAKENGSLREQLDAREAQCASLRAQVQSRLSIHARTSAHVVTMTPILLPLHFLHPSPAISLVAGPADVLQAVVNSNPHVLLTCVDCTLADGALAGHGGGVQADDRAEGGAR